MASFGFWAESTRLGWFVTHYPWVWPACETLHFLGLALLIGNVGLLDLRLLGCWKGLPVQALNRLIPWAVFGFAINLVTGILFFFGAAHQYTDNVAFMWKLAFMALAGVNLTAFYVSGLAKKVDALGPDEDAPMPAKLVAGCSLVSWFCVMYFGRMLPYIGGSF